MHILSNTKKGNLDVELSVYHISNLWGRTILDMTKASLKKISSSRNNLKLILDSLRDGVIAHDLNRRIFYFNKKAEEITGFSRKDIVGRDCHKAFGGPFCGEQCSFCGKTPPPSKTAEYSINITTKNGENRKIEMFVVMMKDEEGKNFGVLATFRDITEIINLKIMAGKLSEFSNIIGQTPVMIDIFQQIRELAAYAVPVHIQGDTGTGKELVARAIHNESSRKGRPFIAINCGALPEGLVESELFGHVKGSFSGAIRDKKGRFELAHGGTIFLDEIAELPKPVQVKLLRFLQEGVIEKVGSEKLITVDTRIISATNKVLKEETQKGNFREDLYYRLNVIPVNVPSLAKRKNDIPLLTEHFLKQAAEKNGGRQKKISDETISIMMDYSWPGNVRELENIIQFANIKCRGDVITPDNLPADFTENSFGKKPGRGRAKKLNQESVKNVLVRTGGNKAKAAKILGVGRATLYRFIDEYPEVVPVDL